MLPNIMTATGTPFAINLLPDRRITVQTFHQLALSIQMHGKKSLAVTASTVPGIRKIQMWFTVRFIPHIFISPSMAV